MSIRAIILDVYQTILEVAPPPADAAEQWEFLWQDLLADPARLSLEEFAAEAERVIAREHAAARAAGIPYPEIFWPAVATEVLPELAHLPDAEREIFLYRHAQLQRSLHFMPGAVEALRFLGQTGAPLGIASNSQPYTLREFDEALATVGLSRGLFQPDLCFWSFEAGFSKPDPHVFRLLTARLRARGVPPETVLMVGDRVDNDMEPARAQGWQTWLVTTAAESDQSDRGDWAQLLSRLRARLQATPR